MYNKTIKNRETLLNVFPGLFEKASSKDDVRIGVKVRNAYLPSFYAIFICSDISLKDFLSYFFQYYPEWISIRKKIRHV